MRVIIPLHPDTVRAWVDLLARFNEEHHIIFCVSVLFVVCSFAYFTYQAIKRGMRDD